MLNNRLMHNGDKMRIDHDPLLLPAIGRDGKCTYKSNDVLNLLIIQINLSRHNWRLTHCRTTIFDHFSNMFIRELVHIGPISMVTWLRIQCLSCRRCSFTVRTMTWRATGLIELPASFDISCAHNVLDSPYNENEPPKPAHNYALTKVPHPRPPSRPEPTCASLSQMFASQASARTLASVRSGCASRSRKHCSW